MLLTGVTGSVRECAHARGEALAIAREHCGVHAGLAIGKAWAKSRFARPYPRNTLWEAGCGVDTVGTAVDWARVTPTMRAMEATTEVALAEFDEQVHVFIRSSHVYPQGSSIHSTRVLRSAGDCETDFTRWQRLKQALSEAVVAAGGTPSHQHGVGEDHKPCLPAEKGGELGLAPIRSVIECLDPEGMKNPGKLLD